MKRSRKTIEFRRRKVEQMILTGINGVREITRRLQAQNIHTSPATTSRDIKAIEERWAKDLDPERVEKYRIEHIAKINQMERTMAAPSLGVRPGDDISTEGYLPDLELAISAQKARLSLLESKARVLGLHAPTKLNIGGYSQLIELLKEADAKPGT